MTKVRQEYDRREAERERARQEVREEILGHLAALPDKEFRHLTRGEHGFNVRDELSRRSHLAALGRERKGAERSKAANKAAAIRDSIEATEAAGNEYLRKWSDRALVFFADATNGLLSERSDLLREEISRRREAAK